MIKRHPQIRDTKLMTGEGNLGVTRTCISFQSHVKSTSNTDEEMRKRKVGRTATYLRGRGREGKCGICDGWMDELFL